MGENKKKDILAVINKFLGDWGPILITGLTVLGLILTFIQYKEQKNSEKETSRITSCLNRGIAAIFSQHDPLKDWALRYHSEEYSRDWAGAINIFDTVEKKRDMIDAIGQMTGVNIIIDNLQSYSPFIAILNGPEALKNERERISTVIASSSKFIFDNLNKLGFDEEKCKDVVLVKTI